MTSEGLDILIRNFRWRGTLFKKAFGFAEAAMFDYRCGPYSVFTRSAARGRSISANLTPPTGFLLRARRLAIIFFTSATETCSKCVLTLFTVSLAVLILHKASKD